MRPSFRIRGFSLALSAVLLCGATAHAQSGSTPSAPRSTAARDTMPSDTTTRDTATLSLEQALATAQRHNPDYLQTANNFRSAEAARRAAKGSLLPQLNASLSAQYQEGGQQLVSGTTLGANSSIATSAYNVGLTYQLSMPSLLAPRLQAAASRATEAEIQNALSVLRGTVRQQYLAVLQAQETLVLQDTLIANAEAQVELARGRAEVGSGTQLDVQRAEVSLGQQRVQRLRARNQLDLERVRLYQQMGVAMPERVRLTTTFADLPELPPLPDVLALAKQRNPAVQALRSREDAANVGVAQARGTYLPTLTVSTGIGGQTYEYLDPNFPVNQARAQTESSRNACYRTQEIRAALGFPNTLGACAFITFPDEAAMAIRRSNNQFPFNFQRTPRSVTAQISLPLFDGFTREQRMQEAIVQREDARYGLRARELALTADVTAAYYTLRTARETVALQTQNAAKARQELQLTQEQYTVGLATFVDLTTSRATFAQAEAERINAVYDYHKALAALESAIGHPIH